MRTSRFMLVLAASLMLGGAIAAGQGVVFDPSAGTTGVFGGSINISSYDGGNSRIYGESGEIDLEGNNVRTEVYPSKGDFFVNTGGTTNFIVTQDGNIGLGTSNPASNREVTIEDSGSSWLNVENSDLGGNALFGIDSSRAVLTVMTNHDLAIRSGGNTDAIVARTNQDIDIPNGRLNMMGNDIENIGNMYWGVVSLETGAWATSDGNSGSYSVPASGNTNCDPNNLSCITYDGSGQWTVSFEAPNRMDDDWWSASPPGGLCWAVAAGDNEPNQQSWGEGAQSINTDANGHCYANAQMNDCVEAFIKDTDTNSHEYYGVACWDPS